MPKPSKAQRVLAQIYKNVYNKKLKCLAINCESDSINSHLLQRNGILNNITENGHLVEIKGIDVYKFDKHTKPLEFKLIGINSAISLPVFCNHHDTSLFKHIESKRTDFSEYKSQLLFSYRTLCSELRKKERNILLHERTLSAETLKGEIDSYKIDLTLEGTKKGVEDMEIYKKLFEKEIDKPTNEFHFEVFNFPLVKVYASATFSPIDHRIDDPLQEKPLNAVFIHIIPKQTELTVIIGFHNAYCSEWIENYVKSWSKLDGLAEIQTKLTELFATRIESWGMSPLIYKNIAKVKKDEFINYWNDNAMNLSVDQEFKLNLFGSE